MRVLRSSVPGLLLGPQSLRVRGLGCGTSVRGCQQLSDQKNLRNGAKLDHPLDGILSVLPIIRIWAGSDHQQSGCESRDAYGEPFDTYFASCLCKHPMMQMKRTMTESEKKLVAGVKKEMQEPRLAASVRDALIEQAPQVSEEP